MATLLKAFPYRASAQIFSERRFAVLRRDDGMFTIADQYFHQTKDADGTVLSQGWITSFRDGLFGTKAEAEAEVMTRLRQVR